MFAPFFAGSQLLDLPQLALVLFMTVFLTVVGWTFAVRSSLDFESQARLPLTGPDEERGG